MFSTRDMIRLYHEEKYSMKQVAEILGCNESLVASRLGNRTRTREEAGFYRSVRTHYGIIPREFKHK